MNNRRQFLSGCSTLALAATVSPCALSAASLFSRDGEAKQLISYASFSKFIGSRFVVWRGSQPNVVLELVCVRQQVDSHVPRANAPDAHNEKFSLLFRGPRSAALAQDSYTFEHSQMGRLEIFIVPVGAKDEKHGYYQAIFNRPVAA